MASTTPLRIRFKHAVQPYLDILSVTAGAYVDLKSQLNDMASDLIAFDREPRTDADRRLREAVELLRPWTSEAGHLVRIGGESDGGYVMWSEPDVGWAVSIGVGSDVSWDQDVARRGAQVDMFDPTVAKLPAAVPGGTFHRVGIGATPDGDYQPLSALVDLAAPRRTGAAFLKIDVEGREWPALDAADASDVQQFAQITMELHDLHQLTDPAAGARIVRVLRKLWATHLPVHVHANNYARIVKFGGYWFPDTIEASWVRRDFLSAATPVGHLDTSLDRPCDPRTSDVDVSGILGVRAPEPTADSE
jgi:hypothetical protein